MSAQPAQAFAVSERFAVLNLESVALLVPLHEIYSLESARDIDSTRSAGGSVGAVRSADSWFSVFFLSDDLKPQTSLPDTFKVCAILAVGAVTLSLACRSVATLENTILDLQPLPECMRTAGSPIQALAHDGERLLCRTSMLALAAHIEHAA